LVLDLPKEELLLKKTGLLINNSTNTNVFFWESYPYYLDVIYKFKKVMHKKK
jgi:hypothetical protein